MMTKTTAWRAMAAFLCAAMLLGATPGYAAPPGGDGAVQAGGGSLILKNTLRAIAIVIRKMAPEVTKITKKLDGPALKAFNRFAPKIADELEYIAEIPELIPKVVGEKIWYLLVELKVNPGSAKVIAEAIMAAIYIF